MNLTARYITTCLSDYLQDSYSRPGQTLCLASLGCSKDDTADELFNSIDWDSGLPEHIDEEDIKTILRDELYSGVDCRYIDEDGNRCDEPAEDRDSEEPYIYVVLEWDAEEARIRSLISSIDSFHGNQLKDRSQDSIGEEIEVIRDWLKG